MELRMLDNDNKNEDADLLEMRMLICKNWGCWIIGIEEDDLIELRMLNYWSWRYWFFGTEDDCFTSIEDAAFMVVKMLDNETEDADLLELRVLIYWC